jgi:uncharacterized protein (TIGR01777 family)
MNVGITGLTGFVGGRVAEHLRANGHFIRAISTRTAPRPEDLEGMDAIIHLAGEPVAQRWTPATRERIRSSRVEGTQRLVKALAGLARRPPVLVSASAIGYYGSRGDELLTESAEPADDFLGSVAVEWEHEAQEAAKLGIRVVCLRIAMVLGRNGGAFEQMLLPFRLGVGGKIGSGEQWMSWIHIADLLALIFFALETPGLNGPVNASAPNPVTNADFTRALAGALHRPAIFKVPPLALNLLYGEMAQLLYASQRVIPEAAVRAGFRFQFPEINGALRHLLEG